MRLEAGKNLSKAIVKVTGFTPRLSDLLEILVAVEEDNKTLNGITLYRFYKKNKPEHTRYTIRARSSDEAFWIARKEFGDLLLEDIECEELKFMT